jgi:hypothetical protein
VGGSLEGGAEFLLVSEELGEPQGPAFSGVLSNVEENCDCRSGVGRVCLGLR